MHKTKDGPEVSEAVNSIGVTTYQREHNDYSEPEFDRVKRLKELEAENSRLRRAVPELTLDTR